MDTSGFGVEKAVLEQVYQPLLKKEATRKTYEMPFPAYWSSFKLLQVTYAAEKAGQE
ncbi:hypothetical protein [Hymenobacter volaticus]|uniref:Uncharacterized protein n=1 Tax=Hymenobacter volaticus TaxID=2932254 RepID=A0ABY4G708_9BACT|nr:hypothetical protein [Hymenobacter volaticus]UOQ66294.1 hypothetical protein MUN86_22875 [Hymenobacter volaticus]